MNFARLFVNPARKSHFIYVLFVNFYREPFGKRVRNRRAYAVKPARIIIVVVAELSARMKLRENDFHARNLCHGMNVRRDTSAVILNRSRAVGVKSNLNGVRKTVRRLVDGVVYDFPQNVMKTFRTRAADIHTGAHTDRFQAFEYFNFIRCIFAFYHVFLRFLFLVIVFFGKVFIRFFVLCLRRPFDLYRTFRFFQKESRAKAFRF